MSTATLVRPDDAPVGERSHPWVSPGGLAALVPGARPGERARHVLWRRAADARVAGLSPTGVVLARAGAPAAALGARAVGWWEGVAPDEPLVVDEGCDVRIGGVRCDEPTRRALLTWLPPSRRELVALETGLLAADPVTAVSLLLRPPVIWTPAEAAGVPGPRAKWLSDAAFAGLERCALARVGPRHLLRLDAAIVRMRAHAPFAGLPRATATVMIGCDAIRADRAAAATVVATQLARYAWSRRFSAA